jgi:hypothetical protein
MRTPTTADTVSRADRRGISKHEAHKQRQKRSQAYACVSLDVFMGRRLLIRRVFETVDCSLAWSADLLLVGACIDRYAAATAIIAHRARMA